VRIDEITLHPRDNAMILATHGRAIWILDNLAPIQELAAAETTTADAKLFSLPRTAMFRRPSRDRNYEFWGDQTFYGENPPPGAVITWYAKRDVKEVALRITDAGGRQVREISGTVLAGATKAGMQSACWDLRVQPALAPTPAPGGRGDQGGRQGGAGQNPQSSPFGAGCAAAGGGFGGGAGTPGPYVLPGMYNVALVVEGKSVETRPLRVLADPEVALTELERKRMYDMAMEMHDLQGRAAEITNALTAINRQIPEVSKTVGSRSDLPTDVKTSFDAVEKQLATFTTQFAAPAGGRGFGAGGGRGGAPDSLTSRVTSAKNGLMGGMPATAQTLEAYKRAKSEVPKAIAEAQAFLLKMQTLSAALAGHNITLTVQ
jgi:hypothetical protein